MTANFNGTIADDVIFTATTRILQFVVVLCKLLT